MKKFSILFLFFICITVISGCGIKASDIPFEIKKPNNYFYTNQIIQSIGTGENIKGTLFEFNLHKEKELPKEGVENIMGFFKSLKNINFISKPQDLPDKPQYKLYITTNNEKFVLNVYNEKYLSIHPWDGVYSEDYIDMTEIYTLYNLHGLCKYFFK